MHLCKGLPIFFVRTRQTLYNTIAGIESKILLAKQLCSVSNKNVLDYIKMTINDQVFFFCGGGGGGGGGGGWLVVITFYGHFSIYM